MDTIKLYLDLEKHCNSVESKEDSYTQGDKLNMNNGRANIKHSLYILLTIQPFFGFIRTQKLVKIQNMHGEYHYMLG